MKETLKMMKSILTGKENTKAENELIKEYQETKNPSILAYFYCNNFGMIRRISELFPKLTDEDKASFCLQEIDYCLSTFNYNNKFTTYFIHDLKMKYISETSKLYYKKRIVNIKENINDLNELDKVYNCRDIEIEDENILLNMYNLTDIEKEQISLLNKGYSPIEIAKILKQAITTIYMRNAKIKSKILNIGI